MAKITTHTKVQRIIRGHYEKLYSNKLNILGEKEIPRNLPTSRTESENLSRPVTNKGTEMSHQKPSNKRCPGAEVFLGEISLNIQKVNVS